MFNNEHSSSTYALSVCPTVMPLSLDVSQLPGASCTVMDHEYVMLMSTDGASATGRVQCIRCYGEGVPTVHAYEMAIARAASNGLPARDLLQSLSQRATHLATWRLSDDGRDLKMARIVAQAQAVRKLERLESRDDERHDLRGRV
jgi:hypothetical protein